MSNSHGRWEISVYSSSIPGGIPGMIVQTWTVHIGVDSKKGAKNIRRTRGRRSTRRSKAPRQGAELF